MRPESASPDKPSGWKPSPSRPARRAAAALWPPMWIGTDRRAGFGYEHARSKLQNRPWNVGSSSAQRTRSAAIASSVRAPRSENGTPTASASSRSQPTPTPRITRPPDSTSVVATRFASCTGLWSGSTTIPVPSRSRSVWAATNVNSSSGSGMAASTGSGMRRSGAYGYGVS